MPPLEFSPLQQGTDASHPNRRISRALLPLVLAGALVLLLGVSAGTFALLGGSKTHQAGPPVPPSVAAGGSAASVEATRVLTTGPTETSTTTPSPTPFVYQGDPVAAQAPPLDFEPATRYYSETGHLLSGEFLDYYNSVPGAPSLFGLPLTEEFPEELTPGHIYLVQYFENARFEYHPGLPPGRRVVLGALGTAALEGREIQPVAPSTSTARSLYFTETGHTLSAGFLNYWNHNGAVGVFGFPVTEEMTEDGMTVQYFERARFEYHRNLEGTPYAVQLSPLGYQALRGGRFNIPMGTLVRFEPPQLAEGHTAVVEVAAQPGITVTGQYEGRPLFFTGDAANGTAWALIGAQPMGDLGWHAVNISLQSADGASATVTRTLNIVPYPFPSESLQFDPETAALLDPTLLQNELDTLSRIFSGRTPKQYWQGTFRMPLDGQIEITSAFATRRCYACPPGSPPTTYHGGMDMAAEVGTEVHAPAAGVVVFAGKLAERGNTVIIDHGLGVYSLLAHNSKLIATVGQTVQQGDVVSLSGNTGLSNGPHVHWEVHVSGPGVEPLEWVNRPMP